MRDLTSELEYLVYDIKFKVGNKVVIDEGVKRILLLDNEIGTIINISLHRTMKPMYKVKFNLESTIHEYNFYAEHLRIVD